MKKRWGFWIADKRCDKSIGAALKAYRQQTVLYDMSYHRMLRVSGSSSKAISAAIDALRAPGQPSLESCLDGSQEVRKYAGGGKNL